MALGQLSMKCLPVCLSVHLVAWLTILSRSTGALEIQSSAFNLIPPPALMGKLSSNNMLYNAERILDGKLATPHSYVSYGDALYAVTATGLVVNIAPCTPRVVADLKPSGCQTNSECGHLISIRINPEKQLIVLDAYRGLFEVNPLSGGYRQIYDARIPVNQRRSLYLNDFVLMNDGSIILSESSARIDYENEFWIRFEGSANGRLLEYNPSYNRVKELLTGLAYPTGLELYEDGQSLLVSEASRARILKLDLTEERFMNRSIWIANLPGMPEHIRASGRGTYWAGLTYARYSGAVSVMDQYANNPQARNILARRRTKDQLKMMYHKRGLAIELDSYGKIASSLHDPTASKVAEVSEIRENFGILYVGSYDQSAVIRVTLPSSYKPELNADAILQVQRSRCKVSEENIEIARRNIQQKIAMQVSGVPKPAPHTRGNLAPGPALAPGIPAAQAAQPRPQVNGMGSYVARHQQQPHQGYINQGVTPTQSSGYSGANPVRDIYASQSGPLNMLSQQQGRYNQGAVSSGSPHTYGQQPPAPYFPQPRAPPQNNYGMQQRQYPQNAYRQPMQNNQQAQMYQRGYNVKPDIRKQQKSSTPPKNPEFPHGIDPFSSGPPVVLPQNPQPYNERVQVQAQPKKVPPKSSPPPPSATFSKIKLSLGRIREFINVVKVTPKPKAQEQTTPQQTSPEPSTRKAASASDSSNDQFIQAALGGFLGLSSNQQDPQVPQDQNTLDQPVQQGIRRVSTKAPVADLFHPSSPESMGSSSPVEAPPMLFGSLMEMGLTHMPGASPSSSDTINQPGPNPAPPQFENQPPIAFRSSSQTDFGANGPPPSPFNQDFNPVFASQASTNQQGQSSPQNNAQSLQANNPSVAQNQPSFTQANQGTTKSNIQSVPQSGPSSYATFMGTSNQAQSSQDSVQSSSMQQPGDTIKKTDLVSINDQTKSPSDIQNMQHFTSNNLPPQDFQNQAQPKATTMEDTQHNVLKQGSQGTQQFVQSSNPASPQTSFQGPSNFPSNIQPQSQPQTNSQQGDSAVQQQRTTLSQFSGAATIHPKQSQDVSPNSFLDGTAGDKETMGQTLSPNTELVNNDLPLQNPSVQSPGVPSPQNPSLHGPGAPPLPNPSVQGPSMVPGSTDVDGEGSGPKGFIQIVTGPGKYIFIPLSQSSLLDLLKNSAATSSSANAGPSQSQPQTGFSTGMNFGQEGQTQSFTQQNGFSNAPQNPNPNQNSFSGSMTPQQSGFSNVPFSSNQNTNNFPTQSTSFTSIPQNQQQQAQSGFSASPQNINQQNTNGFTVQPSPPPPPPVTSYQNQQFGAWKTQSQQQTSPQSSQLDMIQTPRFQSTAPPFQQQFSSLQPQGQTTGSQQLNGGMSYQQPPQNSANQQQWQQSSQPSMASQQTSQFPSQTTGFQQQPQTPQFQTDAQEFSYTNQQNINDQQMLSNNQQYRSNPQQFQPSNQQYQSNNQQYQNSSPNEQYTTQQSQQFLSYNDQGGQYQSTSQPGQNQPQSNQAQYQDQMQQNQQQTSPSWSQFQGQTGSNQMTQLQQQQQYQTSPSVSSWTQVGQGQTGSNPTASDNLSPSPTPRDLERLSQNVPQWSLSQSTTSSQDNSFSNTHSTTSYQSNAFNTGGSQSTMPFQNNLGNNDGSQTMGSYSTFSIGSTNQNDAYSAQTTSGGSNPTTAYVTTWQASGTGSVMPQSSPMPVTGA